jgi:hypothetical protein
MGHSKINCRVCQSKTVTVFSLGNLSSSGHFPTQQDEILPSSDLTMVICENNDCSLVQLKESISQELLFTNSYGYRSGLNKSMLNHLELIADQLKSKYLNDGAKILDIGSNDGSLLNFFTKSTTNLYGVDPISDSLSQYYDPNIERLNEFFSNQSFHDHRGTFDLVTSVSMFYDLPDPLSFAKNVKQMLSERGVWFVELAYLPSTVTKNSYDTICHEHLEYYSLKSLSFLFDLAGLKIINLSFNEINGGSVALTLTHKDSRIENDEQIVNYFLNLEDEKNINSINGMVSFYNRIEEHRKHLIELLETLDSKSVWGLGASTKGNTLLQYCGIDNSKIKKIADPNQDKWGRFTPKSLIPIVSEKQFRDNQPDYALVLPWHFKNTIMEKEKVYLKNGGRLIFPLPEIQVVGI